MNTDGICLAYYDHHDEAEAAARDLIRYGVEPARISIAGLGYHLGAEPTGLERAEDPLRYWGKTGEFWGGVWAVGSSSLFLAGVGPVVLGGELARRVGGVLEIGYSFGGLSPIGTALFEMGLPAPTVRECERALRADRCLLLVSSVRVHDGPALEQLSRSGASSLTPFFPEPVHAAGESAAFASHGPGGAL